MASQNFSVSFPDELLGKLDTMRGDIVRSDFLQKLVQEAWDSKKHTKPKDLVALASISHFR